MILFNPLLGGTRERERERERESAYPFVNPKKNAIVRLEPEPEYDDVDVDVQRVSHHTMKTTPPLIYMLGMVRGCYKLVMTLLFVCLFV